MLDNKTIQFGSASASRTSMSYDSSSSRTKIRNFNDTLEIGYRNTEIHHTNQVRLTFANGQNIFSNNGSTTFTGTSYHAGWYPSSNGGTFKLNDNARLAFGNQADTNFFHNNSHFYLQNTTGNVGRLSESWLQHFVSKEIKPFGTSFERCEGNAGRFPDTTLLRIELSDTRRPLPHG